MTKDAEKLLYLMYKRYLSRIKSGKDRASAKCFNGLEDISELLPKENRESVLELCRELGRLHMLHNTYASNTVYRSVITDEAIEYMESRFKNGLKEFASFFSQFLP